MKSIERIVADNINKLLKEHNMTKNDLAKIADVSESTVGKWTLEKASPRMGAIEKISNYFNVPKSYILEEEKEYTSNISYTYYPTSISAGSPLNVEAVTDAEQIEMPNVLMGRYANNKRIFFLKANGDSMNRVIPDGSLMGVLPIERESLKDGDIVVFSNGGEYSVKYFFRANDTLIFKPSSTNIAHHEQHYPIDADINIYGKVVIYNVIVD